MLEAIYSALREHYDIPEDARISIEEDVYGGSCCHDVGTKEVSIGYFYVPKGKKREVYKQATTCYGTMWDLINELDSE